MNSASPSQTISAAYRFFRDTSTTNGFLSPQSPLADALKVLSAWQETGLGRTYELLTEDDDVLVARLAFLKPDQQCAAKELHTLCLECGIVREHLESSQ